MSTGASEMTCLDCQRRSSSYVDGELRGTSLVDVEEHLARCETCRERVHLAMALRGTLKRAVHEAAPTAFRDRVTNALRAEMERQAEQERQQAVPSVDRRWHYAGALAAAAALLAVTTTPWNSSQRTALLPFAQNANLEANPAFASLIAEHAHPLPPEQTDPGKVKALGEYVGVPVRTSTLRKSGARLVGGRVLPLQSERAAMLTYEMGNPGASHRVSVFIFDPRRIHIEEPSMRARDIGALKLKVGRAQGYSLALMERSGVGYAIASDLEEESSAQLAALVQDNDD
jgi:anti-sigma factor RsiW